MKEMNDRVNAVILSGGGAYGAYEVGVMKALFSGESPATGYRKLKAKIFTGTSVGAVNAAVMVARPGSDADSTVGYLEDVWINEISDVPEGCGNRVYRFRADPFRYFDIECFVTNPARPFVELRDDSAHFARDWLKRGINFFISSGDVEKRILELFDLSSFISVEPFKQLLRKILNLADIRQSDKVLRIAATNWTTGKLRLFGNEDLTDEIGYQAILGSTAIPGFFPPGHIAGDPYVDGGLVMNTPLLPAIRAGADVVHAIYLDPDVKNIPVMTLRNTLDTFDRAAHISFAVRTNEDIATVRWINRGLTLLERVATGGNLSDRDLRDFIRVAGQIKKRRDEGFLYRKLMVHRYRPHDDLGGALGLLDFKRNSIVALIERGFEDALNHNCDASDCVLPDE